MYLTFVGAIAPGRFLADVVSRRAFQLALIEIDHIAAQVGVVGVAVAKEIELEDPFENLGDAARATRSPTKTTDRRRRRHHHRHRATPQPIYRRRPRSSSPPARTPCHLKRGIDIAVTAVVKDIERRAKKVQSSEEIAQIGTIAANGDKTIGKMISEAMKKVGNEGVITVEEAKSLETELDVVEGLQFDQRLSLSPHFVTDAQTMDAAL